jgi:hypothetical protein
VIYVKILGLKFLQYIAENTSFELIISNQNCNFLQQVRCVILKQESLIAGLQNGN